MKDTLNDKQTNNRPPINDFAQKREETEPKREDVWNKLFRIHFRWWQTGVFDCKNVDGYLSILLNHLWKRCETEYRYHFKMVDFGINELFFLLFMKYYTVSMTFRFVEIKHNWKLHKMNHRDWMSEPSFMLMKLFNWMMVFFPPSLPSFIFMNFKYTLIWFVLVHDKPQQWQRYRAKAWIINAIFKTERVKWGKRVCKHSNGIIIIPNVCLN